ncbi:MAG: UPF0489 family protein [Patescibacteria group bacterium]|nr:UPF0489 family protein [Patescibacteria group bacterium]
MNINITYDASIMKYTQKLQNIELLLQQYQDKSNNSSKKYDSQDLQRIYTPPSWIGIGVGNNSFSLDTRPSTAVEKLFIPSLEYAEDFSQAYIGDKPVFQDYDEYDNWDIQNGLEKFLISKTQSSQTPISLIDNHNHVYLIWEQCIGHKIIDTGFQLVHIDAHRDEAPCPYYYPGIPSSELQIADYIDAGFQAGYIKKLTSICESGKFEEIPLPCRDAINRVSTSQNQSLILNIDIDIFMPDSEYINTEDKVRIISYYAKHADLITLATSPHFIDQQYAIDIAKLLHKYL